MRKDTVKVTDAAHSFSNDGVQLCGRLGALIGTIALLLVILAFILDRVLIIHDVGNDVTGLSLNDSYKVSLGTWQTCWFVPVQELGNEEHAVCFSLNEDVSFAEWEDTWELITSTTTTTTSMTGSTSTVSTSTSTLTASTTLTSSTLTDTPTSTTLTSTTQSAIGTLTQLVEVVARTSQASTCKRLLKGTCFLGIVAKILNGLAIVCGFVGDIMSEKVFAMRWSAYYMVMFTGLSLISSLCTVIFTLFDKFSPDYSFYLNLAGLVLAYVAYWLCDKDIQCFPNIRRFGLQNDGQGYLSRLGAVTGFLTWCALLMAALSPNWSVTDHLGNDPDNVERTVDHFAEYNLQNVQRATLGILQFCIELPVHTFGDKLGLICLTYDDTVNVTQGDTWVETDGCAIFKSDGNYDVCATRDGVVIALSLALVFAILGDCFSEKAIVNVAVFTVTLASASAALGLWEQFREGLSGPTDYGAGSSVDYGIGLALVLAGVLLALITVPLYIMDYCGMCVQKPEMGYDDEDDDDDDDEDDGSINWAQDYRMFDCNECCEMLCYGDDIGPVAVLGEEVKPEPVVTAADAMDDQDDRDGSDPQARGIHDAAHGQLDDDHMGGVIMDQPVASVDDVHV